MLVIAVMIAPHPGGRIDTGHPPPNSITYNDEEIKQIIQEMNFIDGVFEKVGNQLGLDESRLGYVSWDSTYFFKHCIKPGESKYLPSSVCNVDSVLTENERNQLTKSIHFLIKKGICSSGYSRFLDQYVLDVDYYDYSDGRYLCLTNKVDSSFLNHSTQIIIDQKGGLTLLKNRKF